MDCTLDRGVHCCLPAGHDVPARVLEDFCADQALARRTSDVWSGFLCWWHCAHDPAHLYLQASEDQLRLASDARCQTSQAFINKASWSSRRRLASLARLHKRLDPELQNRICKQDNKDLTPSQNISF
eukprot:9482-Amphidinium_carterae.1